jgi:hypothetical protein
MLSIKDSITLIEKLIKENKHIYGFDGFIILEEGKKRIEQDYSRDYSKFNKNEQHQLVLEYFLKHSKDEKVVYEISHE